MLEFGMAESGPGRRRSMLLASISDATSKPSGLQLPRLDGLPDGLKRLSAAKGRPAASAGQSGLQPRERHLRNHQLRGVDLGRAGAQLQQAAAVAGGVLVAAISQAAQRLAAARPGRGSQTLPFYQSFRLPWDSSARRGSRRCRAWAGATGQTCGGV